MAIGCNHESKLPFDQAAPVCGSFTAAASYFEIAFGWLCSYVAALRARSLLNVDAAFTQPPYTRPASRRLIQRGPLEHTFYRRGRLCVSCPDELGAEGDLRLMSQTKQPRPGHRTF